MLKLINNIFLLNLYYEISYPPHLFCFLLLFLTIHLSGQKNFTAESVELTPLEMAQISEITNDPSQVFTLDIESINEYLSDNSESEKSISFTLLNANKLYVTLEPYSIVSPNCILNRSTKDGFIREPMPQINSFRGMLNGEEGSSVSLTNTETFFSLSIFTETNHYEIASLNNIRQGNNLFLFKENPLNEELFLSCDVSSGPLNDLGPDRFLEVGIDGDYEFFMAPVNGESSINNMVDRMAIASSYFDLFFNLELVIVQAHLWEIEDPYESLSNPSLNEVTTFWNKNLFCVHKDVVHLFTGEFTWNGFSNGFRIGDNQSNPTHLPASGNSTFDPDPNNLNFSRRNVETIVHELAHNLGAAHLQMTTLPQECITILCDNTNNVLMCSPGDGNFNEPIRISRHTQDKITSKLNAFDQFNWWDFPTSMDCQTCEFISLTTDNINPTVENQNNCQTGNSISNFTINVGNGCVPGEKEIRVDIRPELELIEFPDNFENTPLPNGGSRISLTQPFASGQSEFFLFKVKTVTPTNGINIRAKLISDVFTIEDEVEIKPILFNEIAPLANNSGIRLSNIPSFPLIWRLSAPLNSGKNFTINGTLIIDRFDNDGLPFFFEDAQIFMMPGSKIIIEEGIEFQLRNTHIYGCEGMWKGIEVQGPGSTSAARLIVENSLIEDAEIAIDAKSGAELSVTDTRFNLNQIGINRTGDWPVGVDFGEFHSNTFDCDDVLKAPFSGQKALYGLGVNNVPIAFTNSSTDLSMLNVFKNMQSGVVATRSNLIVRNSTFSDITSNFSIFGKAVNVIDGFGKNIQVWGLGVQGNNPDMFQNCDVGVYVKRSNVLVTNAKFSNVKTGVEVTSSQLHRVWVSNNNFLLSKNPIKMLRNSPLRSKGYITANRIITASEDAVGIGIYESISTPANQSWTIANNEVSLFANASKGISINSAENVTISNNDINVSHPLTEDYTGIYIAGSTSSTVNCNNVTNQFNLLLPTNTEPDPTTTEGIGIQVLQSPSTALDCNATRGTTIGINYWGMCDDSENKGNVLQKNVFGVLYGLFPSEGNAFTGPQDDLGNIWDGEFDGSGARHLGNELVVSFSEYTVDEDENEDYLPSWDAVSDWFINIADLEESFSCIQTETCGNPKRALKQNNLNEKISLGTLPTEGYNESLNWTGQQHLYRRATTDEETRTAFQQFYFGQVENPITQLNENLENSKNLYDRTNVNTQEWINQQELLSNSFERITEYQTELFSTQNSQEKAELVGQIQVEKETLDEEQNTATKEAQAYFSSEEQNNQVVSFSTNSEKMYVQNWVTVNQMIANKINDYTSQYSETQIATLTQIANQCILSGGDGVLMARSLLAEVGDLSYNEVELCNTAETNEETSLVEKPSSIFVYPNPTKEVINIASYVC